MEKARRRRRHCEAESSVGQESKMSNWCWCCATTNSPSTSAARLPVNLVAAERERGAFNNLCPEQHWPRDHQQVAGRLNGLNSFHSPIKLNLTKTDKLSVSFRNDNKTTLNSPSRLPHFHPRLVQDKARRQRRNNSGNSYKFLLPTLVMTQLFLISCIAATAFEEQAPIVASSGAPPSGSSGSLVNAAQTLEQEPSSATKSASGSSESTLANEKSGSSSSSSSGSSSAGSQNQAGNDENNNKYSPPVNPSDSSSAPDAASPPASKEAEQSGSPAEPIVQQKVDESAPAVSGLGEEAQGGGPRQTETGPNEQSQENSNNNNNSNQQLPSQAQQGNRESQQSEQDQQLGQLQPENSESVRLRNGENEVSAVAEFGRKTTGSGSGEQQQQQQVTATTQLANDNSSNQQQRQLAQTSQNKASSGVRSLKRAFAGHIGVFGRKRTQAESEQRQSAGVAAVEELQQQAQRLTDQQAKTSFGRISGQQLHYQPSTTRGPTPAGGAKAGKLKSADYPDYREILIQPDQTINERQQPQQQQQQLPAAEEQQRIEPGQVGDAEANEATENQLQQEATTVISETVAQQQQQQQQQEANTEQSPVQLSDNENQQQQQATPGQSDSSSAPFIRLSNIATINSTGSSLTNGSGQGEVKLMRIYVIDLDQKLVVGNGQPGQYGTLGDTSNFTPSATTAAASIDQYSRASDAQSIYATPQTTPGPTVQYTSNVLYQYQQANQSDNQQAGYTPAVYEHQAQQPDSGYVLLDKDSLQGNLSSMFSRLGARGNYSQSPIYLARTRMNYTSGSSPESGSKVASQSGYVASSQPEVPAQGPQLQQATQIILEHPAVSFAPVMVYDSHLEAAGEHYAAAFANSSSNNYTGAQESSSTNSNGYSGQAPITSGYPEGATYEKNRNKNGNNIYHPPSAVVHEQQPTAYQGHQVALYPAIAPVQSSVPKYIAPQYNKQQTGQVNPVQYQESTSGDSYSYSYKQQQQQQPQVVGVEQNYAEPTRYNKQTGADNSNYTSRQQQQLGSTQSSTSQYSAVQAPRQHQLAQDKHHAYNNSHLSVYHQEPVQMYQQAVSVGAAPESQYTNSGGYSLSSPSLALAGSLEPAQQQQQYKQPQQLIHYNKVTTNDGQWKPVDYTAPVQVQLPALVAYSQSEHYQQVPISGPANNNNLHHINGYSSSNYSQLNNYKDHDVVSLANGSTRAAPNGYQLEYALLPTQSQLSQPQNQAGANNYNYSLDGQHAPLTYPDFSSGAKKYNSSQKQLGYANTATESAYSYDNLQTVPVYANLNQRPQLHYQSASGSGSGSGSAANDAPSQQVPTLAHPSSNAPQATIYQYNGTGSPSASASASTSASGQLEQQTEYQPRPSVHAPSSPVTNEYSHVNGQNSNSNQVKQHSAGIGTNYQSDTQYGSNTLSAYGKQGKQAQMDQSYSGALESPNIPHVQQALPASGYKQSGSYKAANASPYLSVSGPPISDGVYESEEYSGATSGTVSSSSQPKIYRPTRPQRAPKKSSRPKRVRPLGQTGSKYPKAAELESYSGQSVENAELSGYQQADSGEHQSEPDSSLSLNYPKPPQSLAYQQPPVQAYNRPPLMAVASYYSRPSQGSSSKGLLSWETISSVASSAAKRLPSLSSIILPFTSSSSSSKLPLYPAYQQPSYSSYAKSAHYDGNVANFHKPYPLRHMSHNGAVLGSYSDVPESGRGGSSKHESRPEVGYAEVGPGNEQHAEYHSAADLASSSSNGNNQETSSSSSSGSSSEFPLNPSHSAADSGIESDESGDPTSDQATLGAHEERPAGKVHFKSGAQVQANTSVETTNEDGSNKGEVVSDLADINDSHQAHQQSKQHLLKGRRPANKKKLKSALATNSEGASEDLMMHQVAENAGSTSSSLDPAHVAVLSSIEHQLSESTSKRSRKKKGSKGPPMSGEFVEPNISVGGHRLPAGINLDSNSQLPVDQQRLLMHEQQLMQQGKKLPTNTGLMFSADGEPAPLEQQLPPMGVGSNLSPLMQHLSGGPSRPQPPSIQLGQYKITPQTQFVHSLIEPSRQMLSQYFKQYVGQLNQFAHGKK